MIKRGWNRGWGGCTPYLANAAVGIKVIVPRGCQWYTGKRTVDDGGGFGLGQHLVLLAQPLASLHVTGVEPAMLLYNRAVVVYTCWTEPYVSACDIVPNTPNILS